MFGSEKSYFKHREDIYRKKKLRRRPHSSITTLSKQWASDLFPDTRQGKVSQLAIETFIQNFVLSRCNTP